MSGTSIATFVAKYSRHAAGSQTIRAASAVFDAAPEFVLLDRNRTIVLAATVGAALQPRKMSAAEMAVHNGALVDCTGQTTAAQVTVPDNVLAALSVPIALNDEDQTRLVEFADDLTVALTPVKSRLAASPAFESAILSGLRDAVIVLDPELHVVWANDGVVTLSGWGPDEIVGRHFASLIHPDDIGRTIEAAADIASGHRMYRLNIRVASAFNTWIPVSVTGFDHSANPTIGGLVLSVRNDERELESERALDETRRVSSSILQNLHEAVIATDDVGRITIINDAARRLFSIDSAVAAGSLSVSDIVLLDWQNKPLDSTVHPLRHSQNWFDQELRVATPTGVRHLTINRTEVELGQGRFGIVVTFHDITQARSDARELRNRALHDQLTGLANRRYLSERLHAFESSTDDVHLAACFVDIDKFKTVNDTHGHRVGDKVLRMTADRLGRQIRDGDVLARTGGDEFLVLLVDPESQQNAMEIADRLRSAFDEPFEVDGERLHLTASVGIAFHDDGAFDDERLLQHADIALYAAKEGGRDRTEMFDQQLATMVALEQSQRSMVRHALDNDGLEMHFQAIVDATGTTVGVEALARCRDAGGNIVAPAGFMDAIDGTNLLVRLDRSGFRQACDLAKVLSQHPSTRHMWVSSNFSATTLARTDFAETVLDAIHHAGVAPSSLCIEVTETAAFEPGESGIRALTKLHAAGLRIALDDFGTGYSSLSHLRDLPLTTVKIDRSFTSELHHRGAERAIASAVTDIADSLGFTVVAEGVETAVDLDAVRSIGVNTMQGWYFARAVPRAELLGRLNIEQREPASI